MCSVLVQPTFPDHNQYVELARDYDLGFELIDFALTMNLDDKQELQRRMEFYKNLDHDIPLISLHGTYHDMRLSSIDPRIRQVAEERLELNCRIAYELGIERVIFHTNYVPQNTDERYFDYWVERNEEFCTRMVEEYDLEILLENVFDFHPRVLARLMESVKSDKINLCFDIGHFNVHSRVPLNRWFSVLNANITYLHLNDNYGSQDRHNIAGRGSIDWRELTELIAEYGLDPEAVLEIDIGTPSSVEKSIEFFQQHNFYPWSR